MGLSKIKGPKSAKMCTKDELPISLSLVTSILIHFRTS